MTPLVLSLAWASTAQAAFPENHFSSGWTSVAPQQPVSVPEPARVAAQPPQLLEGDVDTHHAGAAHMYITKEAFDLYDKQFPGSELRKFIGTYSDSGPQSNSDDNVIEGSWDEDSPFANPWNEAVPVLRHFWNWRKGGDGLSGGLWSNDSSVNRAHKFMTGGYGLDGRFDKGWKKGKGDGVFGLYKKGEKAKAYWHLGHVAHLLQDLSVPAHNLLWPHPAKDADRYETFMKDHHKEWSADDAPIETYDSLFLIFLATGQIAEGYDAGNAGGALGEDGSADRGRRREGGFTDAELREEAAVLLPMAIKRVAALFRYFFRQIDPKAPEVFLAALPDGGFVASAVDDVSGVDLAGFSIEHQTLGFAGWSAWTSIEGRKFTAQPGQRVRVRASARDGAGNVGVSDPLISHE